MRWDRPCDNCTPSRKLLFDFFQEPAQAFLHCVVHPGEFESIMDPEACLPSGTRGGGEGARPRPLGESTGLIRPAEKTD